MDYLKTLQDIKNSIGEGKELTASNKLIVIGLIEKEEETVGMNEDSFVYFYEDVIDNEIQFEFEEALTTDVYQLAQGDAANCLNTFSSFKKIQDNSAIYSWLQNAIRFTDHLALHYLQEIIKEEPERQGDAGTERSRYIQINQKKNDAEKAGRIMNNLYECRNKLEHRKVESSDSQRIIPPNYKRAKKQITRRYPEALICFRDSFASYYNQ
ncbi:hypothetical protein [Poritiphilus flavus]|uniref:Uncharacterized protein n=1 Tax=Poritiphilus flavus TaxID=2697053 RepID=A0A6L9ECX8_9FLAO|nr:hypothetical protein [Poritiphilus flavus]NAS12239.1 hypothetical protein [Poritiphilus flavus]